MATLKPRITISLDPHVYATVKRMSQLGGQPMASIISEMLDTVHEPLMRTVAFLEAAADAPQQIRDGLRKSFEAVERDIYAAAGHTVFQMDWLTQQLKTGGAQAQPTAPGAAPAGGGGSGISPASAEGSTPVPVTRGSGSVSMTGITPSKLPCRPVKTRVSKKGAGHG